MVIIGTADFHGILWVQSCVAFTDHESLQPWVRPFNSAINTPTISALRAVNPLTECQNPHLLEPHRSGFNFALFMVPTDSCFWLYWQVRSSKSRQEEEEVSRRWKGGRHLSRQLSWEVFLEDATRGSYLAFNVNARQRNSRASLTLLQPQCFSPFSTRLSALTTDSVTLDSFEHSSVSVNLRLSFCVFLVAVSA